MDDRKVIGEDSKDVEFSWPIGMPLVRSLGKERREIDLAWSRMKGKERHEYQQGVVFR